MHPELESAFSLAGRTAVITGAANGIGRQAAITFAMAGANVVIADVKDDLAESARLVGELGGRVTARPTDVRQKSEVDALAQLALDTYGGIYVWANVAGIIRYSKIVDTTEDTLRARASGSPLKATGETTDITYAMLYLASDASQFMTGQTLRPNGGVVMP